MGTGTVKLNTGTGADLLSFSEFHHVSQNAERLTRVATANQEWIVKDWDGEVYCIKFNANFSKKHLFTFSKDQEKTKQKAEDEAAKPGQAGQDEQNWHNAEMELLKSKIVKNLDKRAVADVCGCGHRFNAHLHPNPAPPPPRLPGACTTCAGACAGFKTPYGLARTYVGKPTEDPLSGARTSKNTCLILNWVPRAEFEQVVLQSIQSLEKPAGWNKGDPLAIAVGDERKLRWDFGLGRNGAIIVADKTVVPTNYTNFQGCWVAARKIATSVGKQTWEIFHMETRAPHTPF
jgi:hypothetical protein